MSYSMNTDHVYIIAEAGVNHNRDKDMALRLIDAAADAGADAVKFQTFNAKKLASQSVKKAEYQITNTGNDESQLEMLQKLELPLEWHEELKSYAESKNIAFLSTAFDLESLSFLNDMNLDVFKIPSGEITNARLIWQFAKTGKNLILSSGMGTLSDVEGAFANIAHALHNDDMPKSMDDVWRAWSVPENRKAVKQRVSLLHCTSLYPSPLETVNLNAMDTIGQAFKMRAGYSDHTSGLEVPCAAVAKGAKIIEKHFTLDRNLEGPDHAASLEPDELKEMVSKIRALQNGSDAERQAYLDTLEHHDVIMGDGMKAPTMPEWSTRDVARQRLVAAQDIKLGDVFTHQNLTTSRAGEGINADQFWDMIGQKATHDYKQNQPI